MYITLTNDETGTMPNRGGYSRMIRELLLQTSALSQVPKRAHTNS